MHEIRTWSPGLNAGDAGADLVDDADAFVAENAAGLAGRHVALEDVQVGAADRGLGDPDDRIGRRSDGRLGTIFQGLLAGSVIDECFHEARSSGGSVTCFGGIMIFMAGDLSDGLVDEFGQSCWPIWRSRRRSKIQKLRLRKSNSIASCARHASAVGGGV